MTLQQMQSGPLGSLFQGMTQKGFNDFLKEMNKTYGEGTASMLASFLAGGAGFSQSAVNNIFAALQPQINRGTESIMDQFSATGNRFGSDAQLGLADYQSQINLNEGQIETQMYEDAVNNYMSVLTGMSGTRASAMAGSPSTMDKLMSALQIGGAGAGAASAAGVGGTAGSILDVIASMGAAA
jgi:hypothetical protein